MFSFSTRKGGKWKKYKGEREGVEEKIRNWKYEIWNKTKKKITRKLNNSLNAKR